MKIFYQDRLLMSWTFILTLMGDSMVKVPIPQTILKPHLMDHVDSIIAQDLKIFNFEVEEKLDQLSRLEFDGEFDSNSLKALKLYFDPLIGCN